MKLTSALFVLGAASTVSAAWFPFYEYGYDFEGGANDVGNTPGTKIEDCFNQLKTTWTATAKAVSYYQGRCYFKAKRGVVTVKAGVDSTALYWGASAPNPCAATLANTDFVDNDLTNVKADLGECCKKCQEYPGCRAWSWLGGTCYLKSGRTLTISKQDVTSALAYPETPDSNPGQGVLYDTDYVDHDIGNKPGANAESCFDTCKTFPGCHAFSWSNWNGQGTCWLKAKGEQTAFKSGVMSSKVDPNPRILPGLDFLGATAVPGPVFTIKADVKACQDACVANSECKFFSYVLTPKRCFLKKDIGIPTPTPGITSGIKAPTQPACAAPVLDNTDISGLNIGNRVGIPNYDDCSSLCDATDNCNTYSWSDYMGGTCWLKHFNVPADVSTYPSVGVKSCKKIKDPWA